LDIDELEYAFAKPSKIDYEKFYSSV